jgi:hypothetical protein
MKTSFSVILFSFILANIANAYDPPEIIGILTGPEGEQQFAVDFCWIGDQNQDGFDDLLVSDNRWPADSASAVYLYYGGERINNDPGIIFGQYEPDRVIFDQVGYFGLLRGENNPPYFGITSFFREPDSPDGIDFHALGEELDRHPDFTHYSNENNRWLLSGRRKHPCDFNGDGFDDVIVYREDLGLDVFFGGEEFDDRPDWRKNIQVYGFIDFSCGLDINNDNYGDIIISTYVNNVNWFSLYLGSANPDTIPAVHFRADDYGLSEYGYTFTMLPDINGDGYDEWGSSWMYRRRGPDDPRRNDEGFYIFLGSEEPDGEPDIMLEKSHDAWGGTGPMAGGDFNGDGYGDIVLRSGGGDEDHGAAFEFQFHFGSPWFDDGEEIRQPDMFVDLGREYGGEYAHEFAEGLGAVGDYNGDGVDDFVWGGGSTFDTAVIFAGSRDWEVSVPEEGTLPSDFSMTLDASPNPFNDRINISINLTHPSELALSVYDVNGRMVNEISRGKHSAGESRWSVNGFDSGIYFVVVQSESEIIVKKIVCLR